MLKAPIPENEKERLLALHKLAILDTKQEERFDRITSKAVKFFNVPISTISIIDENREWYKSCVGVPSREAPRDISFCGHAMFSDEVFVVEDTLKDSRFQDNPAVIGPPFIRFYAGIALRDRKTGQRIGAFCVKDRQPRQFSLKDFDMLLQLAKEAEDELNK